MTAHTTLQPGPVRPLPAARSTRSEYARVADLIRQHASPDDDFAQGVADYLAQGARGSPDEFVDAPRQWRRNTADRDSLIRATAARLFPNSSVERQANTLADGLARYRDDSFPSVALDTDSPHPPGSLEHLFFTILKHRDAPLSARQLEKIISLGRELQPVNCGS